MFNVKAKQRKDFRFEGTGMALFFPGAENLGISDKGGQSCGVCTISTFCNLKISFRRPLRPFTKIQPVGSTSV